MLPDKTITGFLNELASSSPAPGGGSTAALAGALAASLVSMVCHLTLGKPGYESVEHTMKTTLEVSERVRADLTHLIDEDTKAFDDVIRAFKMPKGTDDEKKVRSESIQRGYKTAAQVPLKAAHICSQLWPLIYDITEKGNKNSITDAGVACLLTYGGVMGALLNVRINLGAIKDESFTSPVRTEVDDLEDQASKSLTKIMGMIHL